MSLGKEWLSVAGSFTDEQLNEIMETTMATMVEMPEDSISYGPRFIEEKVFEAQTKFRELETKRSLLRDALTRVKRAENASKLMFKVKKQEIMSNDLYAQQLSANNQKESYAQSKLEEEIKDLTILRDMVLAHEAALDIVENRIKFLKDVRSDIRTQWDIMNSRIKLGETPVNRLPDVPLV
ncbi:hypothetical protein EBS02_09140, partial [bacterium]|nr:hypothetical protein [bacterium]